MHITDFAYLIDYIFHIMYLIYFHVLDGLSYRIDRNS